MRRKKRMFQLMMVLIIAFLLSGCKKKENIKVEEQTTVEKSTESEVDAKLIYDYQEIPIDISGIVTDYQITEKNIYFLLKANEAGKEEYSIYSTDHTGKETNAIVNASEDMITCFCVKDNWLNYITKEDDNTVFLHEYNMETGESTDYNLSSTLKYQKDNSFSKLFQSDSGYVVFDEHAIRLYDEELQMVDIINAENGMYIDAALSGSKIISVRDVFREDSSAQLETEVINVKEKLLAEKQNLPIDYMADDDFLVNSENNIIRYKTEEGLWKYDIENATYTKLIDFPASYIDLKYAKNIESTGDDTYIKIGNISNTPTIVVFNMMDENVRNSKKKIYVGTVYAFHDLKKIVSDFNRKHRDTEVMIKEYSKISDDPYTQFNLDIATGNAPDIIDLSLFSLEACINQGVLEDLSPYYVNSNLVSKDDIIDSVLSVTERNDKIYYASSEFNISTIIARGSDVSDIDGWNATEMCEYIASKGENVKPFCSEETKTGMLEEFIGGGVTSYVDYSTGECHFDSDDFKLLLEMCQKKGSDEDYNSEECANELAKDINEGRVLFGNGQTSFANIQVYKELYGENISYVGCPSADRNGNYFYFNICLGICANSEHKEDAWKLLEMMLSEEYQFENLDYDGDFIPTRKDCLKALEKAMCTTESYYDKNNRKINPIDRTWNWGSCEISVGPLTEEEVKQFEDLISKINKVHGEDLMLVQIVMEEAEMYFRGERGLEETANIIQNRTEIYVKEHR